MFTNKQLKNLIFPLVVEVALGMLVGTMDVMMVSQVGEFATSGVSLVDSITNLLVQAFSAMATGGSVIAANYIGKGKPDDASKAAAQLIVSNCAVGVVLMLFCLFGREMLLDKIYGDIAPDVKDSAMIYFLITCMSYPFFAIYAGGAALCRAEGNSKVTMKVSMMTNVINVGGNALCILVLKMGTAGVAIPTLVCRMFGAGAMLIIMSRQDQPIHFRKGVKFRFDWQMIRKILGIGIPTGIDSSIFQLGKLLIASLISTLGTVSIAANAVTNTLTMLVIIPGSAMGMAMVPVVGQCIGAGEVEQAKKYTKKIMVWIHIALACTSGIVGIFCPWILKLFNLSDETYQLAKSLVIVYAICGFIYWPESFSLPNALRAGGDATFIMVVSVVSMMAFRISAAYLFVNVFHWGLHGVWAAMYVDWLGRSIPFVIRFFSGKWIKLLDKKGAVPQKS